MVSSILEYLAARGRMARRWDGISVVVKWVRFARAMVAVKGSGISGFTRADALKLGLLCKKAFAGPWLCGNTTFSIPVTDFIVADGLSITGGQRGK
jgi:hypothetical protein